MLGVQLGQRRIEHAGGVVADVPQGQQLFPLDGDQVQA